jgi:hypothetical protein
MVSFKKASYVLGFTAGRRSDGYCTGRVKKKSATPLAFTALEAFSLFVDGFVG